MSKKIVDTIRRTGTASSPTRFIVTIQGSGKDAVRTTLSTPITKVKGPEQFRHGGAHVPMEQYAFQVGSTTYERFADAAAVVLKRHHVELAQPDASDVQEYVQKAFKIIRGEEKLRILKEVPESYQPAIEVAEPVAA